MKLLSKAVTLAVACTAFALPSSMARARKPAEPAAASAAAKDGIDATDPKAAVPAPRYRSAFLGYRPVAELERGDWKAAQPAAPAASAPDSHADHAGHAGHAGHKMP